MSFPLIAVSLYVWLWVAESSVFRALTAHAAAGGAANSEIGQAWGSRA